MTRSLGVVIPAYRPDVDELTSLVDEIGDALRPAELRVELDSPATETAERVADLDATVSVSSHRRGKGAAITQGFDALDTDVLAFVDADGSVPADSFADVAALVLRDDADLAVGSRRHPDADVRSHQTLARRWLGDRFATLARLALDVRLHDYQCGAKAIERDTWTAVRGHLRETGFAWDVELIAMAGASGARILEVPVVWIDRPDSTVDTLGTGYALARTLLAARRRAADLGGRNSATERIDDGRAVRPER